MQQKQTTPKEISQAGKNLMLSFDQENAHSSALINPSAQSGYSLLDKAIQKAMSSARSVQSQESQATIALNEPISNEEAKQLMQDSPKGSVKSEKKPQPKQQSPSQFIEQLNDQFITNVILDAKTTPMQEILKLTKLYKLPGNDKDKTREILTFWNWVQTHDKLIMVKKKKQWSDEQAEKYIEYVILNAKDDEARENVINELRSQMGKFQLKQQDSIFNTVINEAGQKLSENKRKVEEYKIKTEEDKIKVGDVTKTVAAEDSEVVDEPKVDKKDKSKKRIEKILNRTEKALNNPDTMSKVKNMLDKTTILEFLKGVSENKKSLFTISLAKKVDSGYIKEGMTDKEILDFANAQDKDLEYLAKYREILAPLLERVQTNLSFKKSLIEYKSNFGNKTKKKKGESDEVQQPKVKIDPQSGYKMRNFE